MSWNNISTEFVAKMNFWREIKGMEQICQTAPPTLIPNE
jgi:hypothetical protein